MNKIKAILFDMDGVLVDAQLWHYWALNQALSHFGFEINERDHTLEFDGLPTKVKLEKINKERGFPRGLNDFVNELKQKYTIDYFSNYCVPTYQHEYALSRLKSEGYDLALCSNSIRPTVDLMLEKTNLKKYLQLSLSNNDVTSPKPSPEIYLKCMELLGVKPCNCLILEDNDNGKNAAIASGAHLMEIDSVKDVSYLGISRVISEINGGGATCR